MESLLSLVKEWNRTTDSFTKLQHAYALIACLLLISAGIIGLVNYSLGQSILFLATAAVIAFIANGVVWSLLNTFVVSRFSKTTSKSRKS